MRHTACVVAVAGAIATAGAGPAGAEPSGRTLALSCFSCHGPAGRSPDAIPGINGKSAAFIDSSMKAFRDGTRTATIMQRIARGYSDAEIAAMAKYIASQGTAHK